MKYLLKLRCQACGNKFRKTVEVPEGKSLSDVRDPPCPSCSKVQRTKKADWSDGRAPGIGGNNIMNKAIDATAEIVMTDHKMTDLHDSNLRPGDAMTPKLPPRLQAQADSFFGGPKRGQHTSNINTAQIARTALAGGYRAGTPNPVEGMHRAKVKPPIHIVASSDRK